MSIIIITTIVIMTRFKHVYVYLDSGISNEFHNKTPNRVGSMLGTGGGAHANRKPSNSSSTGVGANSVPVRTFKVILVGDSCVGKSSFILRLTKNVFASHMNSTLGVDFQMYMIGVDQLSDNETKDVNGVKKHVNKHVALQLWDTAGQERFRSITKSYFRKADGVLLFFDVSSESSFINVRNWIASAQVFQFK